MRKGLLLVSVFFTFMGLVHGSAFAQAAPSGHVGGVQASKVTAPTPPKGETMRYVIPYFISLTGAGSRTVTGITVNNNTTKDCTVTVQFQSQQGSATTVSCTATLAAFAGMGAYFCSRGIPDTTFTCHNSCWPELVSDTGQVFISSNSACRNISVDAETLYTSDVADTLITGVRQLGLVKFNKGNVGD